VIDLLHLPPLNATTIAVLVLGLVGAAIYGLQHSTYTRRLVIGVAAVIAFLALLAYVVATVRMRVFPISFP
jgi:hypothetical protein